MLVCPQCHYQNPTKNNFCQKCGTSLTVKNCHQCQTPVAVDALSCSHCGATTGQTWLALIYGPLATELSNQFQQLTTNIDAPPAAQEIVPVTIPSSQSDNDTPAIAVEIPSQTNLAPNSDAQNLDDETTETLITTPPPENNLTQVQANVEEDLEDDDATQTLVGTPPEPVNLTSQTPITEPTETSEQKTEKYLDLQQRYKILKILGTEETDGSLEVQVLDCQPYLITPLSAANSSPSALTIPKAAQIYTTNDPTLKVNLPVIHDAWESQDNQIILLQDLSNLPSLFNEWKNPNYGNLELVRWLYKMTELWAFLTPHGYLQSLLEPNNLRIDGVKNLCLQRYYPDKPDTILSLQQLGDIWQALFQSSQRTLLGSITTLLDDLRNKSLVEIKQLKDRLNKLFDELEQTTPLTIPPTQENLPSVVRTIKVLSVESYGLTDIGRQRDHNEDFFGIYTTANGLQTPQNRNIEARGIYILCDGMGGHAGGEVASAQATESLRKYFEQHWQENFPSENEIRQAILEANQVIYEINQTQKSSGSGRMGTTLVLALLQDKQLAIAHVGDSRIYRLTNSAGLQQLTLDHEVGQREIKRGVDAQTAYSRPDAYQLTQALGPRSEDFVSPDVQFFDIQEDTLFILASDGLTDNDLLEQYRSTHLQPYLSVNSFLETGVRGLIDLANQYNGHDNITAILIRVRVQPVD